MRNKTFNIYIHTCLTILIFSCNNLLNETYSKEKSFHNCIDDKKIKKYKNYSKYQEIRNKEISTSQRSKPIKKNTNNKFMKHNKNYTKQNTNRSRINKKKSYKKMLDEEKYNMTKEEIVHTYFQKHFSFDRIAKRLLKNSKYEATHTPESKDEYIKLQQDLLNLIANYPDKSVFVEVKKKLINKVIKYGIFTSNEIKEGQIIGIYTGRIENTDPNKNYSKAWRYPISYILKNEFGIDSLVLDATNNKGNLLQYINSSPKEVDFNLDCWEILLYEKLFIAYVANKDISKGEELLIDYSEEYWKDLGLTPLSKNEIESDLNPSHINNLEIIRKTPYQYINAMQFSEKYLVPKILSNEKTLADLKNLLKQYPYTSVFKDLILKINIKNRIEVRANEKIEIDQMIGFYAAQIKLITGDENPNTTWKFPNIESPIYVLDASSTGNTITYIPCAPYNLSNLYAETLIANKTPYIVYYASRLIMKDEILSVSCDI